MAHHVLFEGGLGSGKTFGMVLLAWYLKTQSEARGAHIQLFSNFEIKDASIIDNIEFWYEVAECQGSICLWDEAHITFNSRKWSSHSAQVATDIMMYTRKLQSLQLYATPSVNNVDSRIRQIIEILVTMRHIPKKGFRFYFRDYQTNEHLKTVFIPMSKAQRIFNLHLYDTHEMVRRFPLPKTERESNAFFDRLEEIHNENRIENKKRSVEIATDAATVN